MIIPPFIKPGAVVGLVTPAGKIPPQLVKQTEKFLDSHGFRHIRGKYVADAWHQYGGSDAHRAEDVNEMIQNPEVDVIWCMRGGYGAIRLLDKIDFSVLRQNPKWLVGFSDITVFHAVLQQQYEMASIHGPMPKNLDDGNWDDTGMNELWMMLSGKSINYEIEPHLLNRDGRGKGTIIGGNLTLISILKGSAADFDPHGKILFIEDVGEYLYSLDRMINGLKISGKLSSLAGLVVGQMTDMQDNNTPFGASAYEIIAEAVKEYSYPVIFNFPSGHSTINRPLMLGAKVKIDVSSHAVTMAYSMQL
ncbi:S66 peptidase family protein [Alkaliflexus imshenetskii]|uniref:S66 peptidase family protein n=1 Tax=Alkaliflexus imshenetskii TaxID=286730 RepID=UPI00047ECCE0|nr:LD-carboxypeptidase [Alkaliflexus imshenetskii]